MNIEHVKVATAYKAQVVPKSARKPREASVRTEMVVGMRTASVKDFETALTVGYEGGTESWPGFEGRLWKPIQGSEGLLTVSAFLEALRAGDLHFPREWNPFVGLGTDPVGRNRFEDAHPLEAMVLRYVESDLSAEVAACATRVAGDFVLLEEGAVMYSSPGPHWRCREGRGPALSLDFRSDDVNFGVARLREAQEFSVATWGVHAPGEDVSVEINRPDCIPDMDKLRAGRALASPAVALLLAKTAQDGPDRVEGFGTTLQSIARLYGRRPEYFVDDHGDEVVCPGLSPPNDEEIFAAVQGARRIALEGLAQFFPGMAEGTRIGSAADFGSFDSSFRDSLLVHANRFDAYEQDRLDIAEPDLDLPPDFGSQP